MTNEQVKKLWEAKIQTRKKKGRPKPTWGVAAWVDFLYLVYLDPETGFHCTV